jgi:hypothetical protein
MEYVHIKLKKKKSFAIKAININHEALRYIHHILLDDDDVILPAITIDNSYLIYTFPSPATIIKLLSNDGLLLQYLSDDHKENKEYALIAIKQNYLAYQFVGHILTSNIDFNKEVLVINGLIYNLLSPINKSHKKLIVIAICSSPIVLHSLPREFKFNVDILSVSIIRDKDILNNYNFPEIVKIKFYDYIKSYVSKHKAYLIFLYAICSSVTVPPTNEHKRHKINQLKNFDPEFKLYFKKKILEYIGLKFDIKWKLYKMASNNII